jgi:transposase
MSSKFTDFLREHFDYFLLHDDDDARRWISAQVDDFAAQVEDRLREFDPFYADYDVGVLKLTDKNCWAAFGPPRKTYRDVTHQTISLASDGLRVFVNTELKSATDRLKTVVNQRGDALRAKLQDLHCFEPFNLVLEKRVQRQASLYDYTPQMQLHSSMLGDEATSDVAWMAFAQTVQRLPLPYLRIERLLRPPDLIGYDAVQRVVEVIKRNHSVVKLLNG